MIKRLENFNTRIDQLITSLAEKLPYWAILAMFLLWPLTFNLILSKLFFGTGLMDFDLANSDEVKYWLEAAAFRTAGLNGGQFGTDHGIASAPFIHFGAHGPFFAFLQGGIGKVIGWQTYTPPIINLSLIAGSLAAFVLIARPRKDQLLAGFILTATFLPLYIYIPSGMQQVLHQCFGIMIAALFIRWVKVEGQSNWPAIWLILVVFTATLFRYTWILLYLPVVLVGWRKLTRRQFILVMIAILGLTIMAFVFAQTLWAPYPIDIRFQIADTFRGSVGAGLAFIWDNIQKNLVGIFGKAAPWIQVFRVQFILLNLAAIFFLAAYLFKRKYREPSASRTLHLISAVNLLGIFVLNITLYYVRSWNDYRIWAPHLLLSMLIFLFAEPKREFWIVLLIGLLAFLPRGNVYQGLDFASGTDPAAVQARIAEFSDQVDDYLVFEKGKDRWCHTVEVSKYGMGDQNINPTLIGLPEGYGIMTILYWKNVSPEKIKPKYILLDPLYLQETAPHKLKNLDLTYLTTTSLGNLYLNNNSACPN